ncbi:hypothetical protein [Tateyamaria sp. Alg231-49]|uniref:hypothetical protein n=1 Tax=Tateyamaria sp. Alg231-49 TaxID=1922219 RepID=UPI000D54B179|nr:hypothetical protein [Tateyamaria sp. Alg231-49]
MIFRLSFIATALSLGTAAASQQLPEEPLCENKGQNGMVTMLLCPTGLTTEALAGEGKLACGDRFPCGAWIWTNASDVPGQTPDSHEKLPQDAISAAIGIWVNEDNQLLTINADKN